MKILHINTNDIAGGAARAAYRLHTGLTKLGHNSQMYVLNQQSSDSTITAFKPAQTFPFRVCRFLRRIKIERDFRKYRHTRPSGLEIFSDLRTQFADEPMNQLPTADICNLHWITNFIDYVSLPSLTMRMPIIWTLHDMNAFTGGCHYNNGCKKFITGCSACPQLGSRNEKDLSYQTWHCKKNIFEKIGPDRLHIVTPSHWLAEKTRQSPLMEKFCVSVIPNGINTEEFVPRDQNCSRNVLGISENDKVVLFVAESVANKRKGMSILIEALNRIKARVPNLTLLSIGRTSKKNSIDVRQLELGYVGNDRLLSLIYSAANIFVIPSLQDNLPNTVIEALSSGTPIIGFDIGGVKEMVEPHQTGIIIPSGDIEALGNAMIEFLLNKQKCDEMSKICRQSALNNYNYRKQADNYLNLYINIIKNK